MLCLSSSFENFAIFDLFPYSTSNHSESSKFSGCQLCFVLSSPRQNETVDFYYFFNTNVPFIDPSSSLYGHCSRLLKSANPLLIQLRSIKVSFQYHGSLLSFILQKKTTKTNKHKKNNRSGSTPFPSLEPVRVKQSDAVNILLWLRPITKGAFSVFP